MDIWRIPSTGGTRRATDEPRLATWPTRVSRRADSDLHGYAARRLGVGALRHGRRAADSARRQLRPRGVPFRRGERRRPPSRRDGRESDVRNLWTAPIAEHVVDESGVSRVRASDRARGRSAIRARLHPLSVVEGRRRRALEVQGRLGDGAVEGRPKAPSPPPRLFRPMAPGSASWSGAGTGAPLCDGGGRHGRSPHRGVARYPRRAVLVSGRKVDRRRRDRGRRSSRCSRLPVDGGPPVRLVEAGASTTTRSGRPMGGSSLYSEHHGRTKVRRLKGVTPEKQPFPCRRSRSGRRQSLSVPTGRQGAGR